MTSEFEKQVNKLIKQHSDLLDDISHLEELDVKLAQMDHFIAEQVMGWTLNWWKSLDGEDKDSWPEYNKGNSRDFVRDAESWKPTTNIKHAWELIEALPKGEYCDLHRNEEGDYLCAYKGVFRAEAPTAPLAICIATIKSVAERI